MKRYPARWIGLVMAAVGLAAAFGVDALTPVRVGAIELFLVAAAPILSGLATERRVYSPATRDRELEEAQGDGFDRGYARSGARKRAGVSPRPEGCLTA